MTAFFSGHLGSSNGVQAKIVFNCFSSDDDLAAFLPDPRLEPGVLAVRPHSFSHPSLRVFKLQFSLGGAGERTTTAADADRAARTLVSAYQKLA